MSYKQDLLSVCICITCFLFLVQYCVPENSVGFQIDLTSFHLEKNLFKHTITLSQRPEMIENASIDPNISGVLPTICVSEVAITQMRSAIVCVHIKEDR